MNIHPDMTIFDIVSTHQNTIAVFKSFDEQANECICCTFLFMTIRDVAAIYNFDLASFLSTVSGKFSDRTLVPAFEVECPDERC
ncbi:hypothetical protein Dpo_1c05750 [Desulfotignum phosphitoxidans DSM 13687]|uniref:Uncharacterized protein n=1 Tax=Desulfotignum phosphitoxidans DSM 13687 TaxID=1286635 RepID=S0G625_9BACT|nr:hypothetical protein Dpo_1c05750 [Desulfotignum phosphitoxidans DSM 13687]